MAEALPLSESLPPEVFSGYAVPLRCRLLRLTMSFRYSFAERVPDTSSEVAETWELPGHRRTDPPVWRVPQDVMQT